MQKPETQLKAAILPVTPLQQNCTLLWNEASMKGVVVDPGGDVAEIKAAVTKIGVDVEKILLTHGHIDHAGGADELRGALGVTIEGPHVADKFLLEGMAEEALLYGVEDARNVTPDRWLVEGDTVEAAGESFEILHCPGHSPGSVVMVCKAAGLILMGDVLFAGSVGRSDFPYGDTDALIDSIKTKLLPLGDEMVFICGHGPMSTIGQERQTNPFIK